LAPESSEPGKPSGVPARTVARSAASAGAATMTSRILGLVREQVIAAMFGAGAATDAYNVAFRIPNLLRDLFAEGAMSAAFVPTFTRYLTTSGRDAAWRLGNYVINALLVVTGILVALAIVFAEPLVAALAAEGYTNDPEKMALTVQLARIMLPALSFIAVAAALMGMLNSLQHFFIPAFSPAMFNVVTIICAFALVPLMPVFGLHPIAAIAIGTLLGGVAQTALQWPTLRREGFRYRPALSFKDEGVQRVLVLMGPGTVGMAATQLNVFVNTLLATSQVEGAVSWLNYAFRLMYLPIGLFGVSLATAVLPAVSRYVVEKDIASSRRTIADGLALMMMLNLPATVGLMVLAVPIVRVIFEHGEFTAEDTVGTANALRYYAIGLIAYSVVRIASPTFYALGKNRIPVIVSLFTVVVNATLNIVLVRVMGYAGLALGTSIAAIFNACALLVLLRRNLGGLNERHILSSLARIGLASLLMGLAAEGMQRWVEAAVPGDRIGTQVIHVGLSIAAGLVVLAASAWVLRIREFREAVAVVMRKLRRRPS
jgi:putative peptidoglycan lipid II flippase